ncbi:MAG: aminotransferase [Acetobacteraceae bacterium]|nr:aminotransferase [Acetobacteraceae bacterium]
MSYRAPPFAATALAVDAPPIPACRAWAERYDGCHGPVLDLTQAVPGDRQPEELMDRLAAAAGDRALAGYGPLEGEPELREAFAAETQRLHDGDVTPADVRVTAGANLAFSLAMAVLAAPGDSVLLPAPWFFNHQMALALRGVQAIPLPCTAAGAFLPDPERAEALLTPRTRAIVLVTPNNPTGAILPLGLIAQFAELCRRRGLWLVLDETYRDFLPFGHMPHRLFSRPDWRDFVVQLYSFSKAYGVPGHRMGAVVAGGGFHAQFVKAVDNIQICPPRPPQRALAWAIPMLREWRDASRDRIQSRALAVQHALRRAPAWEVDAQGAYFVWLRVPSGGPDARIVAERLAREAGLVTLPGSVFGPGGERHLRVAFANVEERLLPAIPARLAAMLGRHGPASSGRAGLPAGGA